MAPNSGSATQVNSTLLAVMGLSVRSALFVHFAVNFFNFLHFSGPLQSVLDNQTIRYCVNKLMFKLLKVFFLKKYILKGKDHV